MWTTRLTVAALAAALVLAGALRLTASLAAGPPATVGPLPGAGRNGLTTASGPLEGIALAAKDGGCRPEAIWLNNPAGGFLPYVSDATISAVNREALVAYPNGLPAGSAIIIACSIDSPPPARTPTPAPPTPTPTSTLPTPTPAPQWSAIAPLSLWVTGATRTGVKSTQSGAPLVPLWVGCSKDGETLNVGYPDGVMLTAMGRGTGACIGWYRFVGDIYTFWMPAEYLSVSPPVAPPTSAPSLTTPSIGPSAGIIRTCIDGDFEGWDGDSVFVLCNGSVVVQSDYAYTYHYAYRPNVTLIGSGTRWEMFVEGVDRSIRVELVDGFQTCISGRFSGLQLGNIYTLCNGQVWRQIEPWTWTWTWYGPDVIIYGTPIGATRMKVLLSGVPHAVGVVRIR